MQVVHSIERTESKGGEGKRLATSFQTIPALADPKTLKEMTEIAREEAAQEAASEGV
jgi:hypothetical protein